jgi:hypothetical protein
VTGLDGVVGLAGADVEVGVPVVAAVGLECEWVKIITSATMATTAAAPMATAQMRNRDGPPPGVCW